jgi:polysaccharide biosynthesis transport protein
VTIAQYVRLLRQQWVLVALITLAGTAGASAYTFSQTPVYQSDTQLFVSTSSDGSDISQLTQGSTFTQQRVKSYTDLLTSPRVLQPVIQQLNLGISAEQLAGQVTASSPLDTVLIDVTVTDTSPQRARDIADAIAAQFPDLVAQLETPSGGTTSPVKVSVTRRAVAAGAPISPKKSLNLALGLLVGLGLGVGAAVLRDTLDRSVKSSLQASNAAQAPVLGAVGDDPQVARTPLITADGFSARAESFRHLRTNIRFLSVDHQLRSLVVTGSVAAEGKTTTAANLAIAIAQSGERVVLIDADLRRPSIADMLGMPSGVGLTTVLLGEIDLQSALQTWHTGLPLTVLTSGPVPPNPSELIGSTRMAQLIEDLTTDGVTVVIDSPPLLPVTDAAVLARVTDGALVVTRVASTHLDQLGSAAATLRAAGATVLGVVLNRVPRRAGAGYGAGYSGGYGAGHASTSYPPDPSRVPQPAVEEPAPVFSQQVPPAHPGEPAAPTAPVPPARSQAGSRPFHGRSGPDPTAPEPTPAAVIDLSVAEQHDHLVDSYAARGTGSRSGDSTLGHATNGYFGAGRGSNSHSGTDQAANGYASAGGSTYTPDSSGLHGWSAPSNGHLVDRTRAEQDATPDEADPDGHWSSGQQ